MSRITFYHYTTEAGKNGIESGRVIRQSKSRDGRDDARYGDGVYLTTLGPDTKRTQLYINNWDGTSASRFKWSKVKCYIALDLDIGDVEEVGEGDRDIFLYPGDLHITSSMNMRSGYVSKK